MPFTPQPEDIERPDVFVTASPGEAWTRGQSGRPSRAWLGLLWCEWFAHSRLLLLVLTTWLLAVWMLPLFAHPDWILLLGLIYAMLAGPAYGGGDVIEGCEEFSFALPATRTERYLARVAVGGGSLLLLTAMNLLVLGLDLPQALARLYLDAGLVQTKHVANPGMLYGLVLAFPCAVFAGSFACAAVTRSRMLVLTSWLWGGLAALILLYAGIRYEELVWTQLNGVFACPLLLTAAAAMLFAGGHFYRQKEVGPEARPLELPAHWWLWVLLFLGCAAIASALLLSVLRAFPGWATH